MASHRRASTGACRFPYRVDYKLLFIRQTLFVPKRFQRVLSNMLSVQNIALVISDEADTAPFNAKPGPLPRASAVAHR